MGLFDLTLTDSAQYNAKEALRTIASECSVWQHLCERGTPAEASERILTSPHDGPWEVGNYTQEQLDNQFCEGQIWAPNDQNEPSEFTNWTGLVGDGHYRNGVLVFRLRRIIRASERNGGEAPLYNHLLAAADLLACQIMDRANTTSHFTRVINQISHTNPAYAPLQTKVAQGDYAHWYYVIHWGDIEED